jgi:chromosome partitioning protein
LDRPSPLPAHRLATLQPNQILAVTSAATLKSAPLPSSSKLPGAVVPRGTASLETPHRILNFARSEFCARFPTIARSDTTHAENDVPPVDGLICARQNSPFSAEFTVTSSIGHVTNRARVIAVANQKGGVAKTTTAINLATSLAMSGKQVLLVDLDPQANLTSGVGRKGQSAPAGTIYEALTGDITDARAFVLATDVEHMSIVPADRQLTGAEIELVTVLAREQRLRRFLDRLRADFDFIFVDTPPSLGLLTLNALVAADSVIVPLNCEYFALEGIADLTATIDRVRAALNPALFIEGVLLTMYDDRTNLGQQVSGNIREFFGPQVFNTVIPRNIRLGEAPSHGVPAIVYDARSRGAEAYVALAEEFMTRDRRPS